MNIYKRELRVNRKSLLIWTLIMTGLGILVMAFYPSISEQTQTLEQIMAGLPKGLLAAFGIENISFANILGYYATKQYTTMTLVGSIYAIILASAMLSKEENEKTIEFLLSKPVSRSKILTAKLFSIITLLIIFNLIITIVMYITLELVKTTNYSLKTFLLLSLAALLLHLTYASLGFLGSVLIRRSQTVLPFSLGLVMVTYFLGVAAALSEKLDFLKYLSPFRYVDAADILIHITIAPKYLIIMLVLNVMAVYISYVLYKRKDFAL